MQQCHHRNQRGDHNEYSHDSGGGPPILRSSGQSISAQSYQLLFEKVPSAFTRLTWTDGFWI